MERLLWVLGLGLHLLTRPYEFSFPGAEAWLGLSRFGGCGRGVGRVLVGVCWFVIPAIGVTLVCRNRQVTGSWTDVTVPAKPAAVWPLAGLADDNRRRRDSASGR